jgi:hypothetical protein
MKGREDSIRNDDRKFEIWGWKMNGTRSRQMLMAGCGISYVKLHFVSIILASDCRTRYTYFYIRRVSVFFLYIKYKARDSITVWAWVFSFAKLRSYVRIEWHSRLEATMIWVFDFPFCFASSVLSSPAVKSALWHTRETNSLKKLLEKERFLVV